MPMNRTDWRAHKRSFNRRSDGSPFTSTPHAMRKISRRRANRIAAISRKANR